MSDDRQRNAASGASQGTAAARLREAAEPAQRPAAQTHVSAPRDVAAGLDLSGTPTSTPQVQGAAKPGMSMDKAIATIGTDGARNITVQKFWTPVGDHLPAGYVVATLPDHGLEVTLEQLAYRKTYAGTGTVKTGLTPVAPLGTKGRMIAKDLVTGETLEQPWTWHLIGGRASGEGFWAWLKRALWKG